jgi:hypothetical protein
MAINAVFQFDSKSMTLISQNSFREDSNTEFGGAISPYIPFSTFSDSNLMIIAFTSINWTNPNCGGFNNFCETGMIYEQQSTK